MTHQPLITKTLLTELGVTLSDVDVASLSEHFENELDQRVYAEIAEELHIEQLEQLAEMRQAPEEALRAWLSSNVPELKEIIEDEAAILLGELASHSDKLV